MSKLKEETTEDRLRREAWEKFMAAVLMSSSMSADSCAKRADAATEEWLKRFNQ